MVSPLHKAESGINPDTFKFQAGRTSLKARFKKNARVMQYMRATPVTFLFRLLPVWAMIQSRYCPFADLPDRREP